MSTSPADNNSFASTSSASSKKKPKRGRSPSASGSSSSSHNNNSRDPVGERLNPTASALSTASPHPLFRLQDDPDSDIILHSSDNFLFWVPKFYLQASSQVFEDTLKIPQPAKPGEGSEFGGLPVIRLEEKANELELLFRYIHRRFRTNLSDEIDDDGLDILFKMADKYDISSLQLIAKEKLIALCSKHPPTAWGLATIYGLPDVAETAMRNFDNIAVAAPKFSYTHQGEDIKGTRPYVPSDVPISLMARVPIASLRRLMKLHNSVVYQDINWDDIASEF